MKKLLSMVLVIVLALSCVSVSAMTIEEYNEVGKMDSDGYTASWTDGVYGSVITGGAANLQGINGTPGVFINRTAQKTAGVLVDPIFPKDARISLKKGYIYYTSAMAKTTAINSNSNSHARLSWRLDSGTKVAGTHGDAVAGSLPTNVFSATTSRPKAGYGALLWKGYSAFRITYSYNITDVVDAENNSISATNDDSYFSLVLTPSDHTARAAADGSGDFCFGAGNTFVPFTIRLDDVYVCEVLATDLKSNGYPAFEDGVAISATSATPEVTALSVTASAYDVNPNLTPVISYQWQQSPNGSSWTDIEGATAATFTPGKAQGGKSVRCMLTASSTTTQNGVKTATFATKSAVVSAVNETISFSVTGATASYSVDGGEAVSDLSEAQIPYGASVKLTFAPEAGKVVNSVSYNGSTYPVTNNEVTLTVTASGAIAATAEERTVSLPKVSSSEVGTPVNSYTFKDVTGKSAIIFVNNDVGYGYTISETGCILIAGDNEIELKNENSANDCFGIRVIGNAFVSGTTYVFRPYIKISGEDDVYGTDKEFKFEEE